MPSPPFPAYETVCPHRIRSDRMGFSSLWIAVSFPWESRFRPTRSPWGDLGGGAPSDPFRSNGVLFPLDRGFLPLGVPVQTHTFSLG
eukprot:scaffold383_cov351-Pavlova_lutheri.AAC.17